MDHAILHIYFPIAIWRDIYVTENCIGYSLDGKCPLQARVWILGPSLVVLFGEIAYPLRWKGYLREENHKIMAFADGDSPVLLPVPALSFSPAHVCYHDVSSHLRLMLSETGSLQSPYLPYQDGPNPLVTFSLLSAFCLVSCLSKSNQYNI